MRRNFLNLVLCAVFFSSACGVSAEDKMVLKTKLPNPPLVGTPLSVNILNVPNLDSKITRKRPDFLVPVDATNLAKSKKVSSSDSKALVGTLALITDGDKEGDDGSWVELGPGKQWIQIDLEQNSTIYAILVWHFHLRDRVYYNVVVQICNDQKFEKDVTTIFDNTVGSGKDLAYIENYQGKLIDAKGVKGRYVRLYSNGNTDNIMNHYIEVEVFGQPATTVGPDASKVPLKTRLPNPLLQ